MDDKEPLSSQIAYKAMYEFLDSYYQRTGSDDVGALLGSMSLLEDGCTADPACWQDWLDSIDKAKSGADISLKLKK